MVDTRCVLMYTYASGRIIIGEDDSMPKTRTITELDYNEFDKLCIEKLGLMRDFTIIAAMEWGNDEEHSFDVPSKWPDREDMDEIYAAIKDYQTALALNGGVDPDATFKYPEPESNELIRQARRRLIEVTNYRLHDLAECLHEQGHLATGDYLISVSW